MSKLRFFFKRLPQRARDGAFTLACSVLLPIATNCKVCNLLRGLAIGALLGASTACVVISQLLPRWVSC